MPSPRTALSAVACAVLAAVALTVPVAAAPTTPGPMRGLASQASGEVTRVVVISVDGLNPSAISKLGPVGTPTFHRLVDEGATTFNARSELEMTLTLPNHTGMVTSRRVSRNKGGHAVVWNDDRRKPRTIQRAAGHAVGSVFAELHAAKLSSAMFAAKSKFSLFDRSWPDAIDRVMIQGDNLRLVNSVRNDLATQWRALTFVHISLPDAAGHEEGFMSPAYLDAVEASDELVGRILETITDTAESREHTLLVLTADHGGRGAGHSDPRRYANYRIPFMAWGPGVPAGVDLYDINPTYADPDDRRVGYGAKRQPIRNGVVGNLVLDVLGLPAIPRSQINDDQDLELFQ